MSAPVRRSKRKGNPSTDTEAHIAKRISEILPRFSRTHSKPRCLHYAPSKNEFDARYPAFLFCRGCERVANDWIANPEMNSFRSLNSPTYKCTGDHEGFIGPTTKKKIQPWYLSDYLKGNYKNSDAEEMDESEEQASSMKTRTTKKHKPAPQQQPQQFNRCWYVHSRYLTKFIISGGIVLKYY